MNAAAFERERLLLFRKMGFQASGRRIADRRGRTTYVIEGGDGPRPTVLIHGGLSEASEWCLLAPRLAGRLVIADRPGCGLAEGIDYRGIDYRAAAVDWVLGLADGLAAERVDLVANSMGGYFAMAFALAHPERVRRLVLVGAPAGLDRRIPLFLRLWGNPVIGRIIGRMVAAAKSPETVRRRVFPMLVAHPERVPRDYLEIARAAQQLPGAGLAARTMLNAVLTLGGWRRAMLMRDALAGLRRSVLFVWGDADRFAPPASGADMAARMADAALEIVPDAGHLPYLDYPEAVAAAVNRFLGEADPA